MPTIQWERKLGKYGSIEGVAMPKELLAALGWKHGDTLIISSTDHEVRIKKK